MNEQKVYTLDDIADAYESGYMRGHNDTVEGCFTDSMEAATDYIEFELPRNSAK